MGCDGPRTNVKPFKNLGVSTDFSDLKTELHICNKLGMPVNGILNSPHMMMESHFIFEAKQIHRPNLRFG